MALAWNAGWVNALRGSNPLSSAREVPDQSWSGTFSLPRSIAEQRYCRRMPPSTTGRVIAAGTGLILSALVDAPVKKWMSHCRTPAYAAGLVIAAAVYPVARQGQARQGRMADVSIPTREWSAVAATFVVFVGATGSAAGYRTAIGCSELGRPPDFRPTSRAWSRITSAGLVPRNLRGIRPRSRWTSCCRTTQFRLTDSQTRGQTFRPTQPSGVRVIAGQTNLLADCSSCFGLCCVALPFSKSSDFATNKNAGDPCKNLQEDFGCGIHTGLRKKGFTGCTVYDCFGAGQKVSQQTYDGISWRDAPETASDMFETFPVVRQLHELLWYLAEARSLKQTHSIRKGTRRSTRRDGKPDQRHAFADSSRRRLSTPSGSQHPALADE